jgi:hypothetical protein
LSAYGTNENAIYVIRHVGDAYDIAWKEKPVMKREENIMAFTMEAFMENSEHPS